MLPRTMPDRSELTAAIAGLTVLLAAALNQAHATADWHRPVDQNVFTTDHGNNHDTIFFVEPDHPTHKYHLIVSHETSGADYWRTNDFSWSSGTWELVSGDYDIGGQYEYDDGVKVGDTYYIYEAGQDDPNGIVYTYTGDLADADGNWTVSGSFPKADADGNWTVSGSFPKADADDVGVWYEDGVFHMYGENGTFSGGFDGATLAHLTSETGLGDWTVQRTDAVVPGEGFGVGDATIAKIDGKYWLYSDRESESQPYRITAWSADSLYDQFQFEGVAIAPREGETDDYDNERIQDGDIGYVSELDRWVMFANVRDRDGNPGPGNTQFVGAFYSGEPEPEPEPEPGVIFESDNPIPVGGDQVLPLGAGDVNNDAMAGLRTMVITFDVELTGSTQSTDWLALGMGFDGNPPGNAAPIDVVGLNSSAESDAAALIRTLDAVDSAKDHQLFVDGAVAHEFPDVVADGATGRVRILLGLSEAGIDAGEAARIVYQVDEDGDGAYDASASATMTWTDAVNYLWLGSRGGSSHLVSNLRIARVLDGDANLDGAVDGLDIGVLVDNFGEAGAFPDADFNFDGVIDGLDIGILVDNFGQTIGEGSLAEAAPTALSSVPEPTTIALLGLGALAMFRRRR